jgi:hypothetical protein
MYIPNHTDQAGRYAFGAQPGVGLWNCARLGEALLTLISEADAMAILENYRGHFAERIDARMRAKLGLASTEPEDERLIHDFLAMMHSQHGDYARSFRALSRWREDEGASPALLEELPDRALLEFWLARYQERLEREQSLGSQRHTRMLRVNPKFILRNWMAQEAIQLAETRHYDRIEVLRKILASPFDEHSAYEEFAAKPPAWAKEIVLSCSS